MYLKIEPEACEATDRDQETQILDNFNLLDPKTDDFPNTEAEIILGENQ